MELGNYNTAKNKLRQLWEKTNESTRNISSLELVYSRLYSSNFAKQFIKIPILTNQLIIPVKTILYNGQEEYIYYYTWGYNYSVIFKEFPDNLQSYIKPLVYFFSEGNSELIRKYCTLSNIELLGTYPNIMDYNFTKLENGYKLNGIISLYIGSIHVPTKIINFESLFTKVGSLYCTLQIIIYNSRYYHKV